MALLLVAALDIGVPGHSLTDTHGHAAAPERAWCGSGSATGPDDLAPSVADTFHHDDCFGCCANILPEHVFRLLSSSIDVPCAVETQPGDTPPLATHIFHPPNA